MDPRPNDLETNCPVVIIISKYSEWPKLFKKGIILFLDPPKATLTTLVIFRITLKILNFAFFQNIPILKFQRSNVGGQKWENV